MKNRTIEQVINEMNPEDVKRLAIGALLREADSDMKNCIIQLHKSVLTARSSGITSLPGVADASYQFRKKSLEQYGLWNPQYEIHYELALRGELNLSSLFDVQVE